MQTLRNKVLPLAWPLRVAAAASLIWIPLAVGVSAQEPAQEADRPVTAATVVPQQVRYAGKLAVRAGETVEAEFRIYAAQEGGEPLWTEAQQIPVALDGSYSVLLGSASSKGLPQTVFAGGAARWLGISVDRSPEQERVLLSSVPYAMKSADAESLAGHAASDFVTQEQLAALATPAGQAASPEAQPQGVGPITGVGTTGNVALFTGANAIGNSEIVQVGSDIGINVTTPAATLDVGGTATVRGTLDLPAPSLATTSTGSSSQKLELGASSYSSTLPGPVAQNFVLETTATGNNTATPSALLQVLFGSGATSPTATGLSISPNGHINFASGQPFPYTGTVTGITTTAPLTGNGSSGSIAIGFSTSALETTLNTVYPQLTAANTFHSSQTIDGGLTTTSGITTSGVVASGVLQAVGGFLSNNSVQMKNPNVATATTGYNSPVFEFVGSAYNSLTSAAVNQYFSWQALISGNDTSTPTANLALLAGSGSTQSPTGFSISEKGIINWASGQTFPGTGAGTITGITTTSPLTGSGTSGSVALGLNQSALVTDITPSLETTFDTRYALLSGGNIFSSYLEAYQTAGPGNAALYGWGSSGSTGTFGDSDTGYGVQGESTSGQGVYAQVTIPAAGSEGVLGFTGSAFSTTYSSEAGIANAGIWADNSAAGTGVPVSFFATGDDVYGAAIVTNGADFPSLFVDNNTGTAGQFQAASGYGVNSSTSSGTGVYGATSGSGDGVEGIASSALGQEAGVLGVANLQSITGGSYNIYAGAWGDTGTSSTTVAPAWAIGVLGTADDGHAGVFLNNSTGWSTMYIENYGTGGTGLFKTLMARSADGACGIGSGGSLSCTGQIKSLVSAGNGARTVETYAVQSPENWMEDFGSGQLEKGVAVVSIDPAFAETVTADSSYHVFLTPNGDSKGLYVISKTPNTFEVRESGGGTSSLAFDYRIVAKRRGFEAQRLVDVTERFNTEMKAASMVRSSGAKHAPARPDLKNSPLHAALSAHARRLVPHQMPMAHKPMARPASATAPRP